MKHIYWISALVSLILVASILMAVQASSATITNDQYFLYLPIISNNKPPTPTPTSTETFTLTATFTLTPTLTFTPIPTETPLPTLPLNPVKNGGFEQGMLYWSWYNTHYWDGICESSSLYYKYPHSGSEFACWPGFPNEASNLVQQNISMGVGKRYLHFWYWIYSQDLCGYDYAHVQIGGMSRTFSLCKNNNTNGWVHDWVYLGNYTGQTISLVFDVISDSTLESVFLLDDVSITTSSTTP